MIAVRLIIISRRSISLSNVWAFTVVIETYVANKAANVVNHALIMLYMQHWAENNHVIDLAKFDKLAV